MNRPPVARALVLAALSASLAAPAADRVDHVTGPSRLTADGHPGRDGRSFAGAMREFSADLGLTAQQKTDIQIITADYAERLRDLARLGRTTADGLLAMAPDDPAYRAKTEEASALAASSAAEVVVLLAEMRAKLYAVLTPDQRALLAEKRAEVRRRIEQKRRQDPAGGSSHDRPFGQFAR